MATASWASTAGSWWYPDYQVADGEFPTADLQTMNRLKVGSCKQVVWASGQLDRLVSRCVIPTALARSATIQSPGSVYSVPNEASAAASGSEVARQTAMPQGRRNRIIIPILILLMLAGAGAWLLVSPRPRATNSFTGYVVADNLYLAAPIAGTVQQLWVRRGERVALGAPLFRIDPTSLAARADEARAQIDEAVAGAEASRAALANARAAFAKAETEAERAATDLAHYRSAENAARGAVARQELDQARFAANSAGYQRVSAKEEISAAAARVASARAQVARTKAALIDAERQVAQLSPLAPTAGTIEETLYQPGEWAPANAPVISLIPDGQVKVRFYVPQALVAQYRYNTRVALACDGCAPGLTAIVDRVASRPEYTPPVIYSLKQRDKLVFMVEAVPSRPQLLTPGQPIDVAPLRTQSGQ
jgi:HlyD family secretion protein